MIQTDRSVNSKSNYQIRYGYDSYDIHIMLSVSCRKPMFWAHEAPPVNYRLPAWIWELNPSFATIATEQVGKRGKI